MVHITLKQNCIKSHVTLLFHIIRYRNCDKIHMYHIKYYSIISKIKYHIIQNRNIITLYNIVSYDSISCHLILYNMISYDTILLQTVLFDTIS